jgi:Trypsin
LLIFRINRLSCLGVDKNPNDAAVMAQEAELIDKLITPAAQLDPERFRLQPARRVPHSVKRLEQAVHENFVSCLSRGKTGVFGFGSRGGAQAKVDRDSGHEEKNHARNWLAHHEWSMNITAMQDFFRITPLLMALAAARRVGISAFLACLLGLFLPMSASALVGPTQLAPEFKPYVVMILDNGSSEGASYCSASVIAQDVVLTAAHCVSSPSTTQVFFLGGEGKLIFLVAAWITWTLASVLLIPLAIRFGRIRPLTSIQAALSLIMFGTAITYYLWPGVAERLVFSGVASIAINPGYRPNTGQDTASIDLALVRLAKPLPSSFKPIELLHHFSVETGEPLRIVGFGHTDEEERGTSGVLRTAVLAANGPKSPVFMHLTSPAGYRLGGCTGDSGAPVFVIGRPALVAVAIRAKGEDGYACGADTEAVLTGPQLPWIHEILDAWSGAKNLTL